MTKFPEFSRFSIVVSTLLPEDFVECWSVGNLKKMTDCHLETDWALMQVC